MLEERLRGTLDGLMEGCAILSPDWRYVYVNEANALHARLSREQMLDHCLLDLLPGVEASPFFSVYKRCMEERIPQSVEAPYTFADGTSAWYEIRAYPVPEGIFVLSRDITENRRHEIVYSTILRTAMDGFWIIAGETERFQVANDAFCQMLGYSREELFALGPADVETGGTTTNLVREVIERGFLRYEASMRRKDGTLLDAEISVNYIPGPPRLFGFCRDVSDRKRMEGRLHDTLRELERSNHDLDQFAHMAAHDLQQPLTQIMGYLDMLAAVHGRAMDAEPADFLRLASQGAARMARTVEGLLTYARLGGTTRGIEAVDLGDCLRDALINLSQRLDQTGASVDIGPLPVVRGDRQRLTLVVQNLLSNALKFSGGAIPRVEVMAESADGEVIISIRDHGPGIAHEFHHVIFDAFRRLNCDAESQGSGLGLAICKRIVEAHGGRIWVESAKGLGSAFRFALPTKATTAA